MSKAKSGAVLPGQASIFSFFSKAGGVSKSATSTPTAGRQGDRGNIDSPSSAASKASTPSQSQLDSPSAQPEAVHHDVDIQALGSVARKRSREGEHKECDRGEHEPLAGVRLRRSARSSAQGGTTTYTEDDPDSVSESDSDSATSGMLETPADTLSTRSKSDRKQARMRQSVETIQQSLGQFQYDHDKSSEPKAGSRTRAKKDLTVPPGGERKASTSAPQSKKSKVSPAHNQAEKTKTQATARQRANDAVMERMKRWKAKEERKVDKEFAAAVENVERCNAQEEWEAAVSSVQESMVIENDNNTGSDAKEDESDQDVLAMTSYERERQARIRQNNDFLMNLGITMLPAEEPSKSKPKPKSKPKRKISPPPPSHRPRRSTRSSGGDFETTNAAQKKIQEADALEVELQEAIAGGTMEEDEEGEHRARIKALREEADTMLNEMAERKRAAAKADAWQEEEEEEELQFDDSSVKRYTCQPVQIRTAAADLSRGVSGLAPLEDGTHEVGEMKRIYSVSFHPAGALVAGGGHGGYAGVFAVGRGGDEDGGALLTWKAHGGWLGEVHFLSQQTEGSNLLLTASNDNSVVLWDVNSAAKKGRKAVPKKIAEEAFHSGGLFSLNEAAGAVITSGKDGNVVLSTVTSTALVRNRVFESVHDNHVIKCVRFRSFGTDGLVPNVFASGGNDYKVCVTDTRISMSASCVQHWEAAGSAVNFVQWSPVSEHLLMSSSFDRDIRLWDVRSTNEPLHSFVGHHDVGAGKVKGMHRACFFAGGRFVAATGDRTDLLSVYDVSSGAAVSRGATGNKGAAAVCHEANGACVLAIASPQCIQIFTPTAP